MGEKLAAVRQGLREVWPYLLWVLASLAVAGGIWALIYVPIMQVAACPRDQMGLLSKVCFDIENEARKTVAYIMGGALALIGIYMAHRRIRALESQVQIGQEQLQVAQEGQITERFTRAIEQLGSDKVAIRLGGIYSLERIANDSDKDYWPIMETLTACVRERAGWKERPEILSPHKEGLSLPVPKPEIKPSTDIQAVLTVLGRRKYWYGQGETERLNLRGTDLRGASLEKLHFEGADLGEAHLEGADLDEAYLEGVDLRDSHLNKANLWSLPGAFRSQLNQRPCAGD